MLEVKYDNIYKEISDGLEDKEIKNYKSVLHYAFKWTDDGAPFARGSHLEPAQVCRIQENIVLSKCLFPKTLFILIHK